MTRYNLIILHVPRAHHVADFLTVRNMMYGKAPDIEVIIATQDAQLPNDFWQKASERPTLLFSPMPMKHNPLVRGRLLMGRNLTKAKQAEMFFSAGLAIPMTTRLLPDTRLDEQKWGPFVVLKPNLGRQGLGVRMVRTRDARWTDPLSWPKDDPRHGHDALAQQYVDTGAYPSCFRVFSVLGKVIYSIKSTATQPLPALDARGKDPIDIEVAANGEERSIRLNHDQDILDFGRDVHAKFPELPSLGIDILRHQNTGELFVMEMNATGGSWHLSSNYGLAQQRKYGLDYYNQFGALGIMADAFIDATRRLAS